MDRVCAGGRRAEAKRQDCSDVIKRWTRAMWLGLKTVEPPASSWAYIYNNADGQHLKNVSPASALLATTLIAIPQLQKKKNTTSLSNWQLPNCGCATLYVELFPILKICRLDQFEKWGKGKSWMKIVWHIIIKKWIESKIPSRYEIRVHLLDTFESDR